MSTGSPAGLRARRVLAPNPGPMTLEGTNTWLLAEPGAPRCVVVDPGPDHPAHLAAVLTEAAAADQRVALILLTHRHSDHSAGAPALAAQTGAPVRAVDPAYRSGASGLRDGEVVEVDGLHVQVVATPGHSDDSVSLLLPAEAAVLTGDHVLGRGTTVVAWPDGDMRAYLDSLRRLADLAPARLLPGHGPVVDDPAGWIDYYLRHRAEREAEVLAAVAAGAGTPAEVVRRVYRDVDPRLHPAAELSVRAQLALLVATGRVRVDQAGRHQVAG